MNQTIASKLCAFLLLALGLIGTVRAQDLETEKARLWEIGVEPLRIDLDFGRWGVSRYMNLVQPMPGFYVRRYFDRVGFRVGTQIGKHYIEDLGRNCNDCGQSKIRGMSFGLYSGVSYQLTQKVAWLHAIGDLSWQMYRGKGESRNWAWGPQHDLHDLRTQEVMLRIGLNLRVPVTQHFFIGTEMTLGTGVRGITNHREDLVEGGSTTISSFRPSFFEPLACVMIGMRL